MNFSSRKLVTTCLLAILLSHAALSVHAATHAYVDSIKCEICASFSDSPVVSVNDSVAIEAAPASTQFREMPPGSANDQLCLPPPVRGPPNIA